MCQTCQSYSSTPLLSRTFSRGAIGSANGNCVYASFSLLRLSPVQDWEDSHQAIAVKREGIGEEDAKVSLKK